MGNKGPRITKKTLRKNNKIRGLEIPNLKISGIIRVGSWVKYRQIGQ